MSDDAKKSPATDPLDETGGRALVEAWRLSGLSGAAFCRERQLRPQRLHYWRERLGYPIKVTGTGTGKTCAASEVRPSVSDGFVQVVVREPATPVITHVEIVVGGVIMRVSPGFDAELLREVVAALCARPSRC